MVQRIKSRSLKKMKNAGHRTGLGASCKKASALKIKCSSSWLQKISAIDMWLKWTNWKKNNSSSQNKWPNNAWLKSEKLRLSDLKKRRPPDFSKFHWRKALGRGQAAREVTDRQGVVALVTFKTTLSLTTMEAVLTWTRARTPSKQSHFISQNFLS